MRKFLLAALLSLGLSHAYAKDAPAKAAPADDAITIATKGCSVSFTDPYLATAWVLTLEHEITADDYMVIYKRLKPGNVDAVATAQQIVDGCMGQGT